MINNIEKSILNTIVYFDIFNFPLTQIEIYKNLYSLDVDIGFDEFLSVLENSEILKSEIDSKEGFYFIKGKEDIIYTRKDRYILAYKKYNSAIKYIKKLLYFPCFRSINICNTLAIENSKESSDIDLFIITKHNRIWTARFVAIIISKLLNLRPKKNNQKNKICLSFYIDEDNLDIENVSKNDNIYFIYWISQLVNIYDENNIFNKFFDKNIWIKKYIRNIYNFDAGYMRKVFLKKNNITFRNIFSLLSTDNLENRLKKIQINKMNIAIKNKLNINDDVFIDKGIIKLHTNDRREQYKDEFDNRIKKYYEKYI